ncbi:MAG: hypothetical protein K1X83_10715 [Oligoflexia bacterium]|nr:hypothetical protein [Oligoflexia bacterium]
MVTSSENLLLDDRTRAEDILLGSLGFDDGSSIVTLNVTDSGYSGTGRWADGEHFEFECDEELDGLQRWALEVFLQPAAANKNRSASA